MKQKAKSANGNEGEPLAGNVQQLNGSEQNHLAGSPTRSPISFNPEEASYSTFAPQVLFPPH